MPTEAVANSLVNEIRRINTRHCFTAVRPIAIIDHIVFAWSAVLVGDVNPACDNHGITFHGTVEIILPQRDSQRDRPGGECAYFQRTTIVCVRNGIRGKLKCDIRLNTSKIFEGIGEDLAELSFRLRRVLLPLLLGIGSRCSMRSGALAVISMTSQTPRYTFLGPNRKITNAGWRAAAPGGAGWV